MEREPIFGCLRLAMTTASLAVFLFAAASPRPAEAADTCPLVTRTEVSEAFEGEVTLEVQSAASDGCVFTIEERSFSQVQVTNFETHRGSGVVETKRGQIESGEIEGEVIGGLGAAAVLTGNNLWIRLDDGAVVGVSISIHFEQLRPMLDDEVKKAGLLDVGRLVVGRIEG